MSLSYCIKRSKPLFKKRVSGFTIIELLVVLTIIVLFTTLVFVSIRDAQERAKISAVLKQINQVRLALEIYGSDVGDYPSVKCMLGCVSGDDPFLNAMGESDWNGPYLSLYNLSHPWGGHIGIEVGNLDWDDDGIPDCLGLFLDDDRPKTDWEDNGGQIPENVLSKIDKELDDDNLNTGDIRGNGGGWIPNKTSATGELIIKIGCY